jgi:hypothetical protein
MLVGCLGEMAGFCSKGIKLRTFTGSLVKLAKRVLSGVIIEILKTKKVDLLDQPS